MRRRAEFEALLQSRFHAGAHVRLLFRLRREHPEFAFEIDEISQALKRAVDDIANFDDDALPPDRDVATQPVAAT